MKPNKQNKRYTNSINFFYGRRRIVTLLAFSSLKKIGRYKFINIVSILKDEANIQC